MSLTKDFEQYSKNFGFGAPFAMVFLSVYLIYNTPINENGLDVFYGKINKRHYYTCILLEGDNTHYVFNSEKHKKLVMPKLKNCSNARVWVTCSEKDRKFIMQLELDEKMIIKYNYWKAINVYLVFLLIGLLLIPIVIKAKRKGDKLTKGSN